MPAVTKSKKRSVTAAASGEPSYAPPIYDPAAGKKALEALAPELDRLAEAELITVRVDVEAATYAALGVVGFVSSPDVRARFARLPREEFDVTHVDELELACFAALHALAEARAAGALETEARLPVALVTEALEVEARMQALCEYQLADDPAIKPELDRLRPGTGHRDLANDLLGYARIYELRADVVKADPKHYRADDAAHARELAGAMIQKLSAAMTPRAREAYDRYVENHQKAETTPVPDTLTPTWSSNGWVVPIFTTNDDLRTAFWYRVFDNAPENHVFKREEMTPGPTEVVVACGEVIDGLAGTYWGIRPGETHKTIVSPLAQHHGTVTFELWYIPPPP